LPKPGRAVIVVQESGGCLGYVDETSLWRDWLTKKELKEVTGWFKPGDDWLGIDGK
jgi:hypothetical protein